MILARIILFARDLKRLSVSYRDGVGLTLKHEEKGWVEFDAGGCVLALHQGKGHPGSTKLAFQSGDVAQTREAWIARGAVLGKVREFGGLALCDGEDPEGNRLQISNRA
jgi:hypothetical protein